MVEYAEIPEPSVNSQGRSDGIGHSLHRQSVTCVRLVLRRAIDRFNVAIVVAIEVVQRKMRTAY